MNNGNLGNDRLSFIAEITLPQVHWKKVKQSKCDTVRVNEGEAKGGDGKCGRGTESDGCRHGASSPISRSNEAIGVARFAEHPITLPDN